MIRINLTLLDSDCATQSKLNSSGSTRRWYKLEPPRQNNSNEYPTTHAHMYMNQNCSPKHHRQPFYLELHRYTFLELFDTNITRRARLGNKLLTKCVFNFLYMVTGQVYNQTTKFWHSTYTNINKNAKSSTSSKTNLGVEKKLLYTVTDHIL